MFLNNSIVLYQLSQVIILLFFFVICYFVVKVFKGKEFISPIIIFCFLLAFNINFW